MSGTSYAGACINLLRGIEELRHRYIFIREAFRHDVADLALLDVDRHQAWREKRPRLRRVSVSDRHVEFQGNQMTVANLSPGGCCLQVEKGGSASASQRTLPLLAQHLGNAERRWGNDERVGYKFREVLEPNAYFELLEEMYPVGKHVEATSKSDADASSP